MIVIQLEEVLAGKPYINDMGAVMIKNEKLYYNSEGIGWDNWKEFTHEHLQKMSVATFNKMVEDLMELNPDVDLRTINMSLINHGEQLRKK